MRCYICDSELSTTEIQLDEEDKSEPCTTCWNVIMDTAYTDGFTPGGPEDVDILEENEEIQEVEKIA